MHVNLQGSDVLLYVQGAEVLAGLVKQAAGRITIMAGGGATASNAAQLLALGVPELHSSAKR
jgi:copper homeostasis protein